MANDTDEGQIRAIFIEDDRMKVEYQTRDPSRTFAPIGAKRLVDHFPTERSQSLFNPGVANIPLSY
jgi:hypothetical protein